MTRFVAPVGLLPEVSQAAADASLLLLVGGLAMLSLIVFLVILQNLFPEKPEARRHGRELRRLDAGLPGHPAGTRRPGRRPSAARSPHGAAVASTGQAIDLALDRVLELQIGEPRVLRSRERTARLRLYACRGCEAAQGAVVAAERGCAHERGGIEAVFREQFGTGVAVKELACRRRGDAACDFEVRH